MATRSPHAPAPANEADQEVGATDEKARQRPSNDSQAPDPQEGRGVDVDTGRPVRRDSEHASTGRDGGRASSSDIERGSGAARGNEEGGLNPGGNGSMDV